jgi:hypothetical protein
MKKAFLQITLLLVPFLAYSQQEIQEKNIAIILDSLNLTASNAQFNEYFSLYSNDAIFLGTDSNERWDKLEFMNWAKPKFEAKQTWKFSLINRNIYLSNNNQVAWFDELLETKMKICRGSGVLINESGKWKIVQYNLSITILNDITKKVVELKGNLENHFMKSKY